MGLAIADLKRFHNVDESPARPSPEKLLWSTVLELALTDLESADGATKRRKGGVPGEGRERGDREGRRVRGR